MEKEQIMEKILKNESKINLFTTGFQELSI